MKPFLIPLLLALSAVSFPRGGTAEQPASDVPVRAAKISFLPPPMEGTISLGIYDKKGKLVRVLHREAEIDDFTAGQDALRTSWDGKDDAGEAAAAGTYSARGFVVGDLNIGDPEEASPDKLISGEKVKVKLVANPLNGDVRSTIEVIAGLDEDASFLATTDGLPLYTVDEAPGLTRVSLTQRPDRSLDLIEDDGDSVEQYHIIGVEKMMAFDCGEFELK